MTHHPTESNDTTAPYAIVLMSKGTDTPLWRYVALEDLPGRHNVRQGFTRRVRGVAIVLLAVLSLLLQLSVMGVPPLPLLGCELLVLVYVAVFTWCMHRQEQVGYTTQLSIGAAFLRWQRSVQEPPVEQQNGDKVALIWLSQQLQRHLPKIHRWDNITINLALGGLVLLMGLFYYAQVDYILPITGLALSTIWVLLALLADYERYGAAWSRLSCICDVPSYRALEQQHGPLYLLVGRMHPDHFSHTSKVFAVVTLAAPSMV